MPRSILLCAIYAFALTTLLLSVPGPEQYFAPASPELHGDPFARDRFEFEKLKDPATGAIPPGIHAREAAFVRTMPTRMDLTRAFKGAKPQAIEWSFRGPDNLGGRTRAMAVDVSNANVLIAGGVSGGMWRSEDKGATWQRTTALRDLKSVTCVAQDVRPGKTHIWYHGTGETRANSAGMKTNYYGDGLSKSTDGGRTWHALEATVSRTPNKFDDLDEILSVATDPSNLTQDEVYCSTTHGIYRSTDGGATWNIVLGSPSGRGGYTDVICTPSGVLYASIFSSATTPGLWRSVDGTNWQDITPSGFPSVYERIVMAYAPSDESQVYFFISSPGEGVNSASLFKYSGGTFTNLTQSLPTNIETYWSYCMVVAVKPDNPKIVFIGGSSLFRSTDGFATSTKTVRISGGGIRPQHPDHHVVTFAPGAPAVMYNANDGGIYRTDNCAAASITWTDLNKGYVTSQFYAVAIDHNTPGSEFVMGGLQDNGTWASAAATTQAWKNIWGADGGFSWVANEGRTVYASWQGGVLHRLDLNENLAVIKSTRIDPAGGISYSFINPFAVDPNDDNIFYVAEASKIWRTVEAGTIVNAYDAPANEGWTSFTAAASSQVTALAVSKVPSDRLYYGTSNGRVYRMDAASEPGSTPVWVNKNKGMPSGYVTSIDVDPRNADHLIVAFSNYSIISLFHSTDAGETWSPVGGTLEEQPDGKGAGPAVKWIKMLTKGEATMYFAGTTSGLFSTTRLDGMNTVWIREAEDLIGNTVIDMIVARDDDGFVAVATHGNGVYTAKINIDEMPNAVSSAPSVDVLHISPNPFTSQVAISVPSSARGMRSLQVIDLRGVAVQELPIVNEQAIWNGTDRRGAQLPAGVYILTGQHQGTVFVQRVIKQ